MGRPSKLTPVTQAAIVERIDSGATPEIAAECEGVDRSTFYRWMAKGEADQANDVDTEHRDFYDAITRTRARVKASALQEIREAVTAGQNPAPDWRARAWYLERTERGEFSQQVEIRVEQEIERVVERLREGLDPGTFDRVFAILVGKGSGESEQSDDGEPTEH